MLITCRFSCTWLSLMRMIEPLPNCFSIWASAALRALLLSSERSAMLAPFIQLVWCKELGLIMYVFIWRAK
ncbi:hypothetical protein D3C78_1386120 [compost metagenome]